MPPSFPGKYFVCEIRLAAPCSRWKHNMPVLLLPVEHASYLNGGHEIYGSTIFTTRGCKREHAKFLPQLFKLSVREGLSNKTMPLKSRLQASPTVSFEWYGLIINEAPPNVTALSSAKGNLRYQKQTRSSGKPCQQRRHHRLIIFRQQPHKILAACRLQPLFHHDSIPASVPSQVQ